MRVITGDPGIDAALPTISEADDSVLAHAVRRFIEERDESRKATPGTPQEIVAQWRSYIR